MSSVIGQSSHKVRLTLAGALPGVSLHYPASTSPLRFSSSADQFNARPAVALQTLLGYISQSQQFPLLPVPREAVRVSRVGEGSDSYSRIQVNLNRLPDRGKSLRTFFTHIEEVGGIRVPRCLGYLTSNPRDELRPSGENTIIELNRPAVQQPGQWFIWDRTAYPIQFVDEPWPEAPPAPTPKLTERYRILSWLARQLSACWLKREKPRKPPLRTLGDVEELGGFCG